MTSGIIKTVLFLFMLCGLSDPYSTKDEANNKLCDNMESVSCFWAKTEGTILNFSGKKFKNGELIRTSENIHKVMPQMELDNQKLYHQEITFIFSGNTKNKIFMDIYQHVDEKQSCTYAYGFSEEIPTIVGCTFIDLQAPLKEGHSWEFVDQNYLGNQELGEQSINYKSTITQTNIKISLPGGELDKCLIVKDIGISHPETPVTCKDGTSAKVEVKIERFKTYCPQLGSVKETAVESYYDILTHNLCMETSNFHELKL